MYVHCQLHNACIHCTMYMHIYYIHIIHVDCRVYAVHFTIYKVFKFKEEIKKKK